MVNTIIIPSFGATGGDVVIERWLVAEGDQIQAGQAIFVVSTDKANMDVEAFRAGYLRRILATEGATVTIGGAVALIADSSDEPLPETAATRTGNGAKKKHLAAPLAVPERPVRRPPVRRKKATTARTPEELTADDVRAMFRSMVMIRRFEDYLYQLFLQGLVPGTLHQYQGQEAVAVGIASALREDDAVFSTHRPVGHLMAKGCTARAIAAEIWGKETGCVGGKGGQMHLMDMSVCAPPSNAIVGGNIPIATGAALGFKLRGEDRVAVSFFGDGGTNIGAAHEGINLAAVKDAPVIFACENNLYGASTHQSLATRVKDVAERAKGYGIRGEVVDGMDVIVVYRAAFKAVERARKGEGPTFLEFKTYRYQGHSRGDPGGYRTKDEVAHWRGRDPIPRCRKLLSEQYGQSEAALDEIEKQCQEEVEESVRFAQGSPDPSPQSIYEHVYAPRMEPLPAPVKGETKAMSMAEALRDGIRVAMRQDPNVFLLGEDVGVSGGFGGGFTVSLGLSDEFGHDRVMDTPISEIAIVGAAVGAALFGMKSIAEMQYGDFVFCAMDQVVNQAAKMRYMSNGEAAVPMVLRLPVGASNRGAQHGQCTESFFMHVPGLKVVCPSNPYDAKGLLLASIRDGNPVVFLEHKMLYGAKGARSQKGGMELVIDVPVGDYEVPLGTLAVKRAGTDVTILANMLMVHKALIAAEQLAAEGISAEVIDVRCLVPLDMDTIVKSLRKTNRLLILEEDNLTGGWGAEIAARVIETAFDELDAPVVRVAAPDTPLPCAVLLEKEYVPSVEKVVAAVKRMVNQ